MESTTNGISRGRTTDWDIVFRTYKVDTGLPMSKRIAHLLDWAAKKHGGVLIPYNILLKYVMGYAHTPRMNNEEVEAIRRRLPSARPILQKIYHRDLKHVSGAGARATIDDLDVVKSSLPTNVRRVNSAHAALVKNAALVDAKKLPTTGPDKASTEWFVRTVTPAVRALASDDRFARLLPPAPTPTRALQPTGDKPGE